MAQVVMRCFFKGVRGVGECHGEVRPARGGGSDGNTPSKWCGYCRGHEAANMRRARWWHGRTFAHGLQVAQRIDPERERIITTTGRP